MQKSISTLDRCVGTDYQDYSFEVLTAKLREHFGSTSNFKFSFFDRIVDSWNSFPFNVHHSGNIRKSSTVNFFFQVIIFLVFILFGFMCLCLSLIELKHIVTHGEMPSMESPAISFPPMALRHLFRTFSIDIF